MSRHLAVISTCKAIPSSFGNITFDSASGVVERFANTGVMFEESFGSTWNRKRWLDVQLGQWMSEDPIKDGENWRAYVRNQPTGATDPSGLANAPITAKYSKWQGFGLIAPTATIQYTMPPELYGKIMWQRVDIQTSPILIHHARARVEIFTAVGAFLP